MSSPQFSVQNQQHRSRASVFFRSIISIPHIFVGFLWSIGVSFFTFFQWWIILFTGNRNEGIWNRQNKWLAYATRVKSFQYYLFDKFPAFGSKPNGEPVSYSFEYVKSASRLSNLFRGLLAIPAYFLLFFLSIGGSFVSMVAWIAIIFSGKHPQGMFNFVLKIRLLSCRLSAYTMYMTDDYPKSR